MRLPAAAGTAFGSLFGGLQLGYNYLPAISLCRSSPTSTISTHISPQHAEYIGELELRCSLFSQPGKLRLMGWANIANAGSYSGALAVPVTTPNYPDITLTRQVRSNYGFVVNALERVVRARTASSPFQKQGYLRRSWPR